MVRTERLPPMKPRSNISQITASKKLTSDPRTKRNMSRTEESKKPQKQESICMPHIPYKPNPYRLIPSPTHWDKLPRIKVTSDKTIPPQKQTQPQPKKKKQPSSPVNMEWRIKTPATPPAVVTETRSDEIEYDFWVNERTLTFCVFPKNTVSTPGSRKEPNNSL